MYLTCIILKSNSKGSGCQSVQNDNASSMPVGSHQLITVEKGQVIHIIKHQLSQNQCSVYQFFMNHK